MGIIMKTIKRSYSSQTRKEDNPISKIHDFMDKIEISNYKINPDNTIDVYSDVKLLRDDIIDGKIPFKFDIIVGDFDCSQCSLGSLENCPRIITGSFDCSNNYIFILGDCPDEVGGDFICHNNPYDFNDLESRCYVKGEIKN